MRKDEKKKFDVIDFVSYVVLTFVMGISFFLFFINVYHFNEVNYTYVKTAEEMSVSNELKSEVENISLKLADVNLDEYKEQSNYQLLVDTSDRLNKCVVILENEKIYNSLNQKEMKAIDIYNFQELYQNDVVNECLVKQLYGISDLNGEADIMNDFMKNNIDTILTDMSYVKNNLLNNSSYSFSTNSSKNNVFDLYKESYYQVVSSYRKTVNFVDMVANWYIKSLGGTNE